MVPGSFYWLLFWHWQDARRHPNVICRLVSLIQILRRPLAPYFKKSGTTTQQRDNDLKACDTRIAPISARDRAEKFFAPDDDCGRHIPFRRLKDCMQDQGYTLLRISDSDEADEVRENYCLSKLQQ